MTTERPLAKPLDLDTTGATASLLCAIHCAIMPLVVTLLPLIGLGFLANQLTEWILVGISAVLGTASLCWGYRTHRRRSALFVLAAGLTLVALGRIAEMRHLGWMGVVVVVLGGLTVASAHFINRSLCNSCRLCHDH